MSLTLSSKNKEISMTSNDFQELRMKIAKFLPKELYEHYCESFTTSAQLTWQKADWENYDKKKIYLNQVYEGKFSKVTDFLYASDMQASLNYGVAKQILKAIGDYSDDSYVGYASKDCQATFKDFKNLLKDCVSSKSKLKWS